jgi:hypothetical protein
VGCLWLFVTAVPDFYVHAAPATPILENQPRKHDELKSKVNIRVRALAVDIAVDHRNTTSVMRLMMTAAGNLKQNGEIMLSALSRES